MVDLKEALDDLLSRWHHWCKTDKLIREPSADPAFRECSIPRHWQTTEEIAEDVLNIQAMKAVDFHVWEMQDPYRSAIHILARNCYTGRSVWLSPRLPQDTQMRAEIVAQARRILTEKLSAAGVL